MFNLFTKNFVKHFFNDYINIPTGTKLKDVMNVYAKLGFPGAIGSMDVTHVKWERCPLSLKNKCKGKESFSSLAFQCVVNHQRYIMHASDDFFGSANDKTVSRYDTFPRKLMNGFGKISNMYYMMGKVFQEYVRVLIF